MALRKGECDLDDYEMMGYHVSNEARGKYYVEVDKSSPYAKGPKNEPCDENDVE